MKKKNKKVISKEELFKLEITLLRAHCDLLLSVIETAATITDSDGLMEFFKKLKKPLKSLRQCKKLMHPDDSDSGFKDDWDELALRRQGIGISK
jgi:hypothetical protein